jgi:predicted ATPase
VRDSAFEQAVRGALQHLHDIPYLQTHPLAQQFSSKPTSPPASAGKALKRYLLDAIESLRPGPEDTPPNHGRVYTLLALRYVEGMTIPAVCARMGIGKSEYFRELNQGLTAIISILGERRAIGEDRDRPFSAEEVPDAATATIGRDQTPTTNLPHALTSFVGRTREIAEVAGRLVEGPNRTRLLTIVGSGGCGKTRLALEVATRGRGSFADGAWFVDLAPLADPTLVPHAVASALGVPEQPGRPIVETLARHLRSRALLLVLDNCEHLLDACSSLVDSLLRACPDLRVLATSREPLDLLGEVAWRLPSLSLPEPDSQPSVESLLEFDAIRLFVERARASQPGFDLDNANAALVARVCRRLDGIPLAIELAAARLRALSLEQISARLDDRFHLLTVGNRAALPRQQTLRAAVDWSYQLLAPAERVLFERLSVLAGSFDLEAAEAICAGGAIRNEDVLDHLATLVDKSLVNVEVAMNRRPDALGLEPGGTRYRLLETLRQYGWERLAERGEVDDAQRRHADYFTALAAQAESELRGPRQLAWFDRLEMEHDNARAALLWSHRAGDAETEVRLAAAMGQFWRLHGHHDEGLRWLTLALDASHDLVISARAWALLWASLMAQEQGRNAAATAMAAESLEISQSLADFPCTGFAIIELALLARNQGDFERASDLAEQALSVWRPEENDWFLAFGHFTLGTVAWYKGDLDPAQAHLEKGLALIRASGDQLSTHYFGVFLARVAQDRGNHDQASVILEENLVLCRQFALRRGIGFTFTELGNVARSRGDFEAARAYYADGLTALQDVGDRQNIALCLAGRAALALDEGQLLLAARLFATADTLLASIGSPMPPVRQVKRAELVTQLRAQLGEDAFAATWADGAAMALDQAIALALATTHDPAGHAEAHRFADVDVHARDG